jgi:hypothetical protein
MQGDSCPPTHQVMVVTLPYAPIIAHTSEGDDEAPTRFCMTCFLDSLQPHNPLPPSWADVQQCTMTLMTALAQHCPSNTEIHGNSSNNETLRKWVLDTLDPSVNSAADYAESDVFVYHRCFGRVMAETIVALYRFLVFNTNAVTAKIATSADAAATRRHHTISDAGRACRATYVELCTFLFALWELLLFPSDAPRDRQTQQRPEPHRLSQSVQLLSPRHRLSPTLLGDTCGSLSASSGCCGCCCLSAHGSTPLPWESNTFATMEVRAGVDAWFSPTHRAAVLQEVGMTVGRLVDVLGELKLPAVTEGEPTVSTGLHDQRHRRCHNAASLLHLLVQEVPLLSRTLLTSGHVCTVARQVLPAFVDVCTRSPLPPLSTARKRRRGTKDRNGCADANASSWDAEPSEAIDWLVRVVYVILHQHRRELAAAVNGSIARMCAPPFLWPAPSTADTGTSLVSTLVRLLKLPLRSSSPLTPLVLVMLRELLTRRAAQTSLLHLVRGGDSGGVTTRIISPCSESSPPLLLRCDEGELVLGERDETAAPMTAVTTAVTLHTTDVSTTLGLLLWHPNGDVVRLTCAVLALLLECPIIEDRDVATASQAAALAVAQQVEPYVVHALDSAAVGGNDVLCAVLVDLLEQIATMLEEEEEGETTVKGILCSSFPVPLGPPTTSLQEAAVTETEITQRGLCESWRVVFHVAHVGVSLFEQLLCGAFFRRAIHQSHIRRCGGRRGAGHGNRGDEREEEGEGEGDDALHRGVDWNDVVQYAITILLETSATTLQKTAAATAAAASPTLTLFAYLTFLQTLAVGMEGAVDGLWPIHMTRLMGELSERVASVVAADVSDSGESLGALPPLQTLLEPRTHLLLIHVTAAYLPVAQTALHRVALLLLHNVVYSPGLVAERCTAFAVRDALHAAADGRTAIEAEVKESRCLLQIATNLINYHNKLVHASFLTKKGVVVHRDICSACEYGHLNDSVREGGISELAHLNSLCAPHPRARNTRSLFDVLLSLHPDAAPLVVARAQFLQALVGNPLCADASLLDGDSEMRNEGNDDDGDFLPSAQASSILELLVSDCFHQKTELLLSVSTWSPHEPFADERTVMAILKEALQHLQDEMKAPIKRLSGTAGMDLSESPVTPLSPGSYGVSDPTAPGASLHAKEKKMCRALLRLLSVLMVCWRWFGGAVLPGVSGQTSGLKTHSGAPVAWGGDDATSSNAADDADDGAPLTLFLDGGETLLLRALLLYVEESVMLRQGVCRFAFEMAARHRLDVCRVLCTLRQQCRSPPCPAVRNQLEFFSGLGAVVVLSALRHLPEFLACEIDEEVRTTAFREVLEGVAASHWLTDVFAVWCQTERTVARTPVVVEKKGPPSDRDDGRAHLMTCVCAPAELLLSSLFRCARTSLITCVHHAATGVIHNSCGKTSGNAQDNDAAFFSDGHAEDAKVVAVTCLRYVLLETQYQLELLQRQRSSAYAASLPDTESPKDSALDIGLVSRRFFRCLLSMHLTPFISAMLRNAAAMPSLRVAASDTCTALILRIASVSLWCLSSTEGSECDGVLTQYALRHVRLCLSLTNAEVEHSYAAVSDVSEDSADDVEEKADNDNRDPQSKDCGKDEVEDEGGEVYCSCNGGGGGACVRGLLPLTLLLLQLLHLLLLRSNRAAVAAADSEALSVFASTARHASASHTTFACAGCADVHVLAAIVQLQIRRLQRRVVAVPTRHETTQIDSAKGEMQWYEHIQLAVFQEQPSNFISSVAYRKRVWVLLAGVEFILRLHHVGGETAAAAARAEGASSAKVAREFSEPVVLGGAAGDLRRRRRDGGNVEWGVVSLLLDWCYGVLIPGSTTTLFAVEQSSSNGGGGGGGPAEGAVVMCEDATDVMTVAARVLYLLLRRCPSLIASTSGLDAFLLAYCSGAAAVGGGSDGDDASDSSPSLPHLVAEGWMLAALLDALFLFPHWYRYARRIEVRVLRFLQRPAVSQLLKRPPPSQSPSFSATVPPLSSSFPSSSSLGRSAAAAADMRAVAEADDTSRTALRDSELRLLLCTLVKVIHTYERNVGRCGRLSDASCGRLLPFGCHAPSARTVWGVGSTHWWTPYAIPSTTGSIVDHLPLLFIFHEWLN